MRKVSFRGNSAHFLALRRRLDLMGYTNLPLGIDSAPLVEQMLEDLVSDTEALQRDKDELIRLKDRIESLEFQIEPLQAENDRVNRDNRQLHRRLVTASEEAMRLQNQHSVSFFELQAENRRLKLLNQQSVEHCKNLQTKNDDLKARLQSCISAPSILRVPETLDTEPNKIKKGSKKSATFPASSQLVALDFDATLFERELENLRKERNSAVSQCEEAILRVNELRETVKQLTQLTAEAAQQSGRNADVLVLQHTVAQQRQEIEKLRAHVRVVNPRGLQPKSRTLSMTRPMRILSISQPLIGVSVDARKLLEEKDRTIESLTETVTKMCVDFAFIHDHLDDLVIVKEAGQTADVIVDTDAIESLQREIEELKTTYAAGLAKKDQQIGQLHVLMETLSPPKESRPACKTCVLLQQRLNDISQEAQDEISKLQKQIASLEAQPPKVTEAPRSPLLGSKQQADIQLDKLRKVAAAQQNELKDCQRKLEEAERKIRGHPDAEQRYKLIVDQLRNEHVAMRNDLKQKSSAIRALNDKLAESQKTVRDLQFQLQKAKEDNARSTSRKVETTPIVGQDPGSMIQGLQQQLQEKTKESVTYERLLSEAQKQLAPLMEVTIPRLKTQIAHLQRGKDEAIGKSRRLIQLGSYLEHSLTGADEIPEATAFFAVLHQLQGEYDGK